MSNNQNLRIAHINVRSLIAGFGEFVDIVLSEGFDIIAVTETWLTPDILNNITSIPGFTFYRQDRGMGRGGGVGVYVSKKLNVQIIDDIDITPSAHLEHIWLKVKLKTKTLVLGNIYRPPSGNLNFFINQLDEILSQLVHTVEDIVCVGDMNVNLLNLNNPLTHMFEAYNLLQLINEPTRITNNSMSLLDPIFITSDCEVIKSSVLNTDNISDHKLVYCELALKLPKKGKKLVTFRDFRNFNYNIFLQELYDLPWNGIFQTRDINTKIQMLNDFLIQIFDKHAPLRQVRVTKAKAPWLTNTLKALMKRRDDALRRYKVSKSPADWSFYKTLRNQTLAAVRSEKKKYINLINSENNPKKTWATLRNLNVKPQDSSDLPLNLNNADNINNYFISVHKKNNNNQEIINSYNNNSFNENKSKFTFRLASVDDVHNAIFSIKSKAYGTDKINITMIKYCSPFIEKYILHIINCCIEKEYFPSNWKCSLVMPLPKTNNPLSFGDLRPVSVLPALSKVLEKIMYSQIFSYIDDNDILNKYQSGFRSSHSTASALCQVTDDIIRARDKGMITALVLLDYSKAFDKIDHELMCAKLKFYGFDQAAVNFVKSYLCNRRQIVRAGDSYSTSAFLLTGVPQGSILGPLFFVLYTTEILNKIELSYHAYADDTQLYHSFHRDNFLLSQDLINENLEAIYNMSLKHNLSLNPNKCVVLMFGGRNDTDVINQMHIKINGGNLTTVKSAKSLGVVFDNSLKFNLQVNKVIQKAYLNLKLLYSNRHILNFNMRKSLCESLVLSHLSYCSFIYEPCLGTVDKGRLQRVQNSCCRLIYGLRKYDQGISVRIKILRWLNISNRAKLHLLSFAHSVILSGVPSYIKEKFTKRYQQHSVNIRSYQMFNIPRFRTSFFKKSFTYNVIKLYNSLPTSLKTCNIRTFKHKLKILLLSDQQ